MVLKLYSSTGASASFPMLLTDRQYFQTKWMNTYRQCRPVKSKFIQPIWETKSENPSPPVWLSLSDILKKLLDTPENWILYFTKSCWKWGKAHSKIAIIRCKRNLAPHCIIVLSFWLNYLMRFHYSWHFSCKIASTQSQYKKIECIYISSFVNSVAGGERVNHRYFGA